MKKQKFTTPQSSLERNLGGNNCRRHACWLCPSYALMDPSDDGQESERTQTRREYIPVASMAASLPSTVCFSSRLHPSPERFRIGGRPR
ncbi:MAG: hypothetical protein KBH25_07270 [Aeromonadaceae bacterium]|nr:hypothetical protein [Aeromonadaceae bacterium]